MRDSSVEDGASWGCQDLDLGSVGGSGGGTPHSGRPFGRAIRLGSHSSVGAALSF